MLAPVVRALLAVALCAASTGCVRAPTPLDVHALVRTHGEAGARGELAVRVLDDPRDVAARLALAKLAVQAGRPAEALEQLEKVLTLGGPLGTRWHPDDRARFARLLAARGRARLARAAPTGLADLERARRFDADVSDAEIAVARANLALVQLRHVDAKMRAQGERTIAELARTNAIADVSWLGALPSPVPSDRGDFGLWLWTRGARRAAWEALRDWRATTAETDRTTSVRHAAYLRAYAWWTPLDNPPPPVEDVVGPARCIFTPQVTLTEPCEDAETSAAIASVAPTLEPFPTDAAGALTPRDAAVAQYTHTRVRELAVAYTRTPEKPPVLTIVVIHDLLAAYRSSPGAAERVAGDFVASSADGAFAHAQLGAFYDALGDTARARIEWSAAVDGSHEPAFYLGLAIAVARAGDPDAALIHGTMAAAASGDPASAWITIANALTEARAFPQALEASRSALDLAGRERLADALAVAAAASTGMGRTSQAAALTTRRERLPALPSNPIHVDAIATPAVPVSLEERDAALDAHAQRPTVATTAQLWVISRTHPRDLEVRRVLMTATSGDDPRRAVIVAEIIGLAGDRDLQVGRAAIVTLTAR